MENTTSLNLEVTFIEKESSEGALPFGVANKQELAVFLKAMLHADDLKIKGMKQFALEE